MIKYLLWLSFFSIPNLSYSSEVKVTLSEGKQVLNCSEEASIDGYFCLDGESYFIIRSFGDTYLGSGKLNGSDKLKSYLINKIESRDSTLVYERNLSNNFRFGGSKIGEVSLSRQYSDLERSIFNLSFSYDQKEKPAPTQKFTKFLANIIPKLEMKKAVIAKKLKASRVNVTLDDGSKVACQRGTSKAKSESDLDIEKLYGNEVVCGIFNCGIDKKGNKRILFSHYSPAQQFNDILYANKDGFVNGPQVSTVSVQSETTPLYSYDYDLDYVVPFYNKYRPEVSEESYLPDGLKGQSDFFYKMNQPTYEMILRDSGYQCNESSWGGFNNAFEKYQDKLINAKLAQYITSVNGILTGYYLPVNQIPDIACSEGGSYYNPHFFSSAKEVSKSFHPKAITKEKAIELFKLAQDMKDIAWDYKQDGCYARAHLMARRFEALGVKVDKAWLKGALAYKENGKVVAEWNFHVAPIVYVESEGAKVEKYIIDPSTFDRPVPVKLWADQLSITKGGVREAEFPFPQNSLMYQRTSLAFSNTTPYLPQDAFGTTEKSKLSRAKETMKLYQGASQ